MKLRVLIAEDEPLSREHLRRLLESEPQAEIVAECATGKDALEAIEKTHPDVLLLDVRLPELDGFQVIRELDRAQHRPAIVFVTGSDSFAVQAFETEAADYLLKPFDRERLRTALRRVRERLVKAQPPARAESEKPLDRLTIKSQGRIAIVKISDVDWISAADNYVEIHVGKTTHLMRATIGSLLARLPQNSFARISRSVLINISHVKEIQLQSHGDYVVVLNSGTSLRGSRKYRADLAELLAGQNEGNA
jgi:two-component system LytT family response regulator